MSAPIYLPSDGASPQILNAPMARHNAISLLRRWRCGDNPGLISLPWMRTRTEVSEIAGDASFPIATRTPVSANCSCNLFRCNTLLNLNYDLAKMICCPQAF
jgi:hypothetical protein